MTLIEHRQGIKGLPFGRRSSIKTLRTVLHMKWVHFIYKVGPTNTWSPSQDRNCSNGDNKIWEIHNSYSDIYLLYTCIYKKQCHMYNLCFYKYWNHRKSIKVTRTIRRQGVSGKACTYSIAESTNELVSLQGRQTKT